jgi:hypothetical protein
VPERAVSLARETARRQLGGPLRREQQDALETVTGRAGVAVLIGQAGTGKGLVIGAGDVGARRAPRDRHGGRRRDGEASRCGLGVGETMTVDALTTRHASGGLGLDERSVIVVDEVGMADTPRLARVVEAASESRAKLLLVGDDAQLSTIGAGGLFGEIAKRAPSAELTTVHRAREAWERDAWAQLRSRQADRPLAEYASRERLHIEDTRVEAGERMVDDWARVRDERPGGPLVMLTDSSNDELDRLNAAAQERRAAAASLGIGVPALRIGRPTCGPVTR